MCIRKRNLRGLHRESEGINPKVETGRFLTDTVVDFAGSAPFAGTLEYNRLGAEPITRRLLQGYFPNQGDAMTLAMEEIPRHFEQLLKIKEENQHHTGKPPFSRKDIFRSLSKVLCWSAGLLFATKADISGPVGKPLLSTWQIICQLIKNAFFNSNLPVFEKEVSISRKH